MISTANDCFVETFLVPTCVLLTMRFTHNCYTHLRVGTLVTRTTPMCLTDRIVRGRKHLPSRNCILSTSLPIRWDSREPSSTDCARRSRSRVLRIPRTCWHRKINDLSTHGIVARFPQQSLHLFIQAQHWFCYFTVRCIFEYRTLRRASSAMVRWCSTSTTCRFYWRSCTRCWSHRTRTAW